MIRPRYALKLARTKLRSKRLLLIVTISVASLVFGVVIAGVLIMTGVSRSADSYLKTALNDKYLVQVSPVIPNEIMGYGSMAETPSDELKAHLLKLQAEYLDAQKKLAAEHGVTFDEASYAPILKPSPFAFDNKDALGNVKEVINRESPSYQLYVNELQEAWLKSTTSTIEDLKRAASTKGARAYYQDRSTSISYVDTFYLADGKEDLTKVLAPDIPGDDAVQSSQYAFTDQSLVSRYILPENQARKDNSTAIPVVLTKKEAVKFFGERLGIAKEPGGSAEKIAWMKELQQKINGLTYQSCYRNSAEVNLVREAMRQMQDEPVQSNSVVYTLPTATCAPVTIKQDSRTPVQKSADEKLKAYQQAAGLYRPPVTQLLTFQIVGIMPTISYASNDAKDLPSLVDSVLGSQYRNNGFIPSQLYEKLSESSKHRDILQSSTDSFGVSGKKLVEAGVYPSIVAFPTAQKAKEFIDAYTCQGYDADRCNRSWMSQVYGPINYLLIEDISSRITEIARVVLPIALAIATVVMSFTMARVIIDSRHETAVFRALGAKRRDITAVYITYSLLVALLVALCAFLLGASAALVVQFLYRDVAADYITVAYGVFDEPDMFSFIGVNGLLLGAITLVILVIGIIAIIPPLARNARRNPIRDMREE